MLRHLSASLGLWLGLGALVLPAASDAAPINGREQTLPPHRPPPAARGWWATPRRSACAAKPSTTTPIDVLTYHYDNGRTGWNPAETELTPATVASSKFGLLTTLAVDGNVFAQPLLVSGYVMPDGTTHDVLIVATGHDTVYAYDAQTYAVLWQVSLGKPQSTRDVGCSDVKPEYGISSTPVILRNGLGAATLYVVAATEPQRFSFHTQLHALDVGTGADIQAPVEISPSATLADGSTLQFDPQDQWNRTSLAAFNGNILVGIGSHCDANSGNISGWLLRYDTSLTLQSAFHTIETPHGGTELASIWMSGFAPSIDASGNVFFVTGNGDQSHSGMDWGESALSLDPTLSHVRSRFTPSSFGALNQADLDFGSGGIMLIPHQPKQTVPPLAVAIGKSAVLYLLDQQRLGGLKPNDSGALQAITLTMRNNAGVWGGPAFASGAAGPTVYVQSDSDLLRAYTVATTGTPGLSLRATGTTKAGYGGALPIVSSNGTTAGSGVVWVVRRSVPIELEAYAASAGRWSNTSSQNSFLTAMQANGRVYVPAYKTVTVFGLTP